jgi:acyl-CoA reductase-like NAD-dependent aldehyde dehydrogenase
VACPAFWALPGPIGEASTRIGLVDADLSQRLDALNPAAALEELAALPLEARPQVLLRLADELERRIDSTVAAHRQSDPLERLPREP